MNTLNRHALGLALAVVLAGAALTSRAREGEFIQGRIVGTADAKVVVHSLESGEMVSLAVGPSTRITLDGVAAPLSDLAIGDSVRVIAERREEVLLATVIVARTPY